MQGDSFTDTLKDQAINVAISTISNMAAKQIGSNYKTSNNYNPTITDKAIQLTSHALLGAATAKARNTDEISGAVSGVVGEVTGEIIQ